MLHACASPQNLLWKHHLRSPWSTSAHVQLMTRCSGRLDLLLLVRSALQFSSCYTAFQGTSTWTCAQCTLITALIKCLKSTKCLPCRCQPQCFLNCVLCCRYHTPGSICLCCIGGKMSQRSCESRCFSAQVISGCCRPLKSCGLHDKISKVWRKHLIMLHRMSPVITKLAGQLG